MNKYQALSDMELVHLLRQDDGMALSELYLRYWDKLLSVACHRLDDLEAAEEVIQDVFFSVWQRRASLEIKHTVSTYLAIAVKYRIINVMDKQYRLHHKENVFTPEVEFAPSPEEYVFEKELWDRIEASVKQLPEKCQIVFRMSREQGLSYKQIAHKLEISEKTVEAHISKALREIRTNLNATVPGIVTLLLYAKGLHYLVK